MATTVHIKGLRGLKAKLDKVADKVGKGLGIGLRRCGRILLRKSKALVPVDIGNLKASGDVRVEGTGFETVVRVGYTAGYAMYVHEDLDAAHGTAYNEKYADEIAAAKTPEQKAKWHPRGPDQQAKFLEQPYRESKAEFIGIIKEEIVDSL